MSRGSLPSVIMGEAAGDCGRAILARVSGQEAQSWRFDEGGGDVWESDICCYSQGHVNQGHHLSDCILEDRGPCYGGRDGVHAVSCTLAAILSAQEGRPVRLEEIEAGYTAYG